jgi:hypothetical protein
MVGIRFQIQNKYAGITQSYVQCKGVWNPPLGVQYIGRGGGGKLHKYATVTEGAR